MKVPSSGEVQTIRVYHKTRFVRKKTSSRYNLHVLPELQLNDRVRLRKPHPCGSYEWSIVRLGADIGLECCTCQHRVILSRRELARRLKNMIPKDEYKK
ncbi:MAG TPA: hypothetical protein DEP80_07075 [Anaerolineae bacterium]|nr:hypothetical protein [Anaerolineae bacterium]HCM96427.1 hypothetical protein [Anaerolineae bacterium]